MSKLRFFIFFFSFLPYYSHSKTVQDVLNHIEKSQNKIPTYNPGIQKEKSRVNIRIQQPSSQFSLIFPEGSAERNYEEKLNKEVEQLKYLSKKLKGSSTKEKVWLRLAKAYSEKAALLDRRAQGQYEKGLQRYLMGETSVKPKLDLSSSNRYNQKATDVYKYYVKNYPKSSRMDEVLFFLGFNHMSLGQSGEAVKYYKKVSRSYPKSEFLNEVNLALADHYFDNGQKEAAKSYYEKVIRSGRSQLQNLATYKLAWTEYKRGKSDLALRHLTKVIRGSRSHRQQDQALALEAKKDLPLFYGQAGDPKRAVTYFTSLMPKAEAEKAMEKLAYVYVDKGDRAQARYLFDRLIRMNPSNDRSFDYQYSLVNMQAASGRTDLYEKELYKWVSEFGPTSPWARKNRGTKKATEAMEKAEISLRAHVLKLHNQSRVSKSKSEMARAEKGYAIYLKSFYTSPYYPEMQFYSSELLYEMGLYKEAVVAYGKVKASKYQKTAKVNALLSLERIMPSEAQVRKRVGNSSKAYPLSPDEKKFVSMAKDYLGDAANNYKRQEVEYRLARLYYSHNYFSDSESLFKTIIKKYPGSKYAKYSSDLLLDSYKIKKDYAGLEKVGQELVALGSGNKAIEVGKIKNIVEQSAFKKIGDQSASKKPEELALLFEGFAKRYPKSELLSEAYYNAAINYEKAGKAKKALGAYEKVSSKKAKLYLKAQEYSAVIYENSGRLNEASVLYEKLGYGKSVSLNKKVGFLTNASLIREAYNDASGMLRIFSKLGPVDTAKNREGYNYRVSQVYSRIGNHSQSLNYKLKFLKQNPKDKFLYIKCAQEVSELYAKKGNGLQAKVWAQKSVGAYKAYLNQGGKAAAAYAAQAEMRLSDEMFYKFLSLKIPSDMKKQAGVIKEKLGLVDLINGRMKKVISYDDAYSIVGALSRLGQVYQHLAFSILNSPVPSSLSAQERLQFTKLLKEKVAPFKANAIQSYKESIAKAEQLEAYGPEHLTSLYELSKLESSYFAYKIPFRAAKVYTESLFLKSPLNLTLSESSFIQKYGAELSSSKNKDETLFKMARFYNHKKYSKMSDLFLSKTSDSFKKTAPYHNLTGLNRILESDNRLATASFKKALLSNSNYPDAVQNLSNLYAQYGGYKSVGSLVKRIYPDRIDNLVPQGRPAVLVNYAVSKVVLGQSDESMAELKSVLKSYPNYLSAYANASIVSLGFQKDKKAGRQYLSQYKKLANSREDFDRIKMLESVHL